MQIGKKVIKIKMLNARLRMGFRELSFNSWGNGTGSGEKGRNYIMMGSDQTTSPYLVYLIHFLLSLKE